ncbi:MAG: AIR synthase-related protein [bacterium]
MTGPAEGPEGGSGPLPPGKLPAALLGRLLGGLEGHPRLVVGPRVGEDAAVIDVGGGRCIVAKSDPITFVEDRIGWYAVHVNANDVACMGAAPAWFLMTLLLPEGRAGEEMVEAIWEDVRSACRDLGATLCGGHTEVTLGLSRPIVCGQMLGEVEKSRLIRGDGARAGDAILLTRPVPVEGTAILAKAKAEALAPVLGAEALARARNHLFDPGISVVAPALAAAGTGRVHAMHDPTEGGLATGVHELADAAGLGARVEAAAVPLSEEGEAICRRLGLDPLGVITSGALLLAVAPEDEGEVRAALEAAGALGARIGALLPAGEGVTLRRRGGEEAPLPRYDADEIGKVL